MNPALSVALLVALSCLLPAFSLFQNQKIPVKSIVNQVDEYGVPANGIIDYIGKSSVEKGIRLEESLVNISLAYFLHSFTHSLTHSPIHSLTHSLTHSFIHLLKYQGLSSSNHKTIMENIIQFISPITLEKNWWKIHIKNKIKWEFTSRIGAVLVLIRIPARLRVRRIVG